MKAEELIEEILRLPPKEQRDLIQQAQKLIRVAEDKSQLEQAAEQLVSDYETDYELTAFTNMVKPY